MSAYCNLAGLYPPSGNQMWKPDLKWQPVPVHTRPKKEDIVSTFGNGIKIATSSCLIDKYLVLNMEIGDMIWYDCP